MKKICTASLLVMAFTFLLLPQLLSEEVSVHVKEATLRSKPSFLGKKMGVLNYADRVTVVQKKGAWLQVKSVDGVLAWIHKNSTTTKTISLVVGSQTKEVSDKEQSIAGKGFNEEVEKEYRKTNKGDFRWVDEMSKRWNISEEELQEFIKEGQLEISEDEGEDK